MGPGLRREDDWRAAATTTTQFIAAVAFPGRFLVVIPAKAGIHGGNGSRPSPGMPIGGLRYLKTPEFMNSSQEMRNAGLSLLVIPAKAGIHGGNGAGLSPG